MVKFTITETIFKYTWDQVAAGLWQRYPNPNSKHVLTEDVLSRRIEGDKLFSLRLLTKTNKVPQWAERFVKDSKVFLVEESVVNVREKSFTTYTRNIGLQKLMKVEEKCVYKINPDNSSWTLCERSAWISCSLYGLSRAIEVFGVKRYGRNCQKATDGFDYVLTSLYRPDLLKDHPLNITHKIKETARMAADIAKSNSSAILGSASASS